jgi:hypothetical protein
MLFSIHHRRNKILGHIIIWGIFLVGLWFSVIKVMGVNFTFIPGDVGDVRFIYYILEHFYRWASGLDHSLWDPNFFYPYTNVLAFSDNL